MSQIKKCYFCHSPLRSCINFYDLKIHTNNTVRILKTVTTKIIACRAGVFLASERSDFLREKLFGRHLGFLRQRKVGERNKFLPWGWLVGKERRGEGEGRSLLACPNPHPAPSNRKLNMAAQWTIALVPK